MQYPPPHPTSTITQAYFTYPKTKTLKTINPLSTKLPIAAITTTILPIYINNKQIHNYNHSHQKHPFQ